MTLETRVGYMTTSILQNECEKAIKLYWKVKNYEKMNEYIIKYSELKKYNEVKNE
jgi:uncharacterized protein with PIN domain